VTPVTYQWYAGNVSYDPATGDPIGQPVEFGAVNLVAADPLLQHTHGLVAAMVVEPEGATWAFDRDAVGNVLTRTSVTVTGKAKRPPFREFVLLTQDDLVLPWNQNNSSNGFNYGSEPFSLRGVPGATSLGPPDVTPAVSNQLVSNPISNNPLYGDPQTPVFVVNAGTQVRWRLLHPGGIGNAEVFTISGHVWQEEPYRRGSTEIGWNPLSQWMGGRASLMPNQPYDLVLDRAGGALAASGDFLYRVYDNPSYSAGWWGVMRVTDPQKDGIVINSAVINATLTGPLVVTGSTVVNASQGTLAQQGAIALVDAKGMVTPVPGEFKPMPAAGGMLSWTFTSTMMYDPTKLADMRIRATSAGGGVFTVPVSVVAAPKQVVLFPLSYYSPPGLAAMFAPPRPILFQNLTPQERRADPVFMFRK
jgi:hypothetical protein